MLMSNSRVVVQFEGHDVFNRVVLEARPVSLRVMFGYVEHGQVVCKVIAVFPHSQHPELSDIHDGCSWNVDVIKEFLSTLILADLPDGLMGLRMIE
jgi:hypothetical protein